MRASKWLLTSALAAITSSALAASPAWAQSTTSACLTQVANSIAGHYGIGAGYTVIQHPYPFPTWAYDGEKWKISQFTAIAVGKVPDENPANDLHIWIFPTAFDVLSLSCSPTDIGRAFNVLAHELLHFVCPPHTLGPAAGHPLDPMNPPTEPPDPPDCNDLNYAVNVAKQTCAEIGRVQQCLANPECPGLTDPEGNPIPGLERDSLPEYCTALVNAHKDMQNRWNTAPNATTAFECNCPSPWSPGTPFPACPTMGAPPGGCEGDAATAYPGNKIIPDCQGCS